MKTKGEHWQAVYQTKGATSVSWYTPHLEDSLRLIREVASGDERLIDVGGGASTLVDDLLDAGYRKLTVLDISSAALEVSQRRLGQRSELVTWIAGDVTTAALDLAAFDVWHDRAVFHFLTNELDRKKYSAQLRKALAPGGHVVVGTFSLAGPTQCSGLDVVRYDPATLAAALGSDFELLHSLEVTHLTPANREQSFLYCVLKLRPSAGARQAEPQSDIENSSRGR